MDFLASKLMISKVKRGRDRISNIDTSSTCYAIIWQDRIEITIKTTFSSVLWYIVEIGENLKRVSHYFGGSRQMKNVLVILVALVVADGIVSQFLVNYQLGYEWNPFLQALVGQDYFLLIKLAGALICVLILWDIHKTRPRAALASSLFFVVFYTVLVYWNVGIYLVVLV